MVRINREMYSDGMKSEGKQREIYSDGSESQRKSKREILLGRYGKS